MEESRTQLLERMKAGQNPPLVWLYCSDSRVDYSMFNARPGDIFTIENAGNVFGLGDESRSTLAYALTHFAVDERLSILVMGHSLCGAVTAACNHYNNVSSLPHHSLAALVKHIAPAVMRAEKIGSELLPRAIEENVKFQMENIRRFASEVPNIRAREINIYGAVYDISMNDDILPAVWLLNAITDGKPACGSEMREIRLGHEGGRNLDEFVGKVMKIERIGRRKKFSQTREHRGLKS